MRIHLPIGDQQNGNVYEYIAMYIDYLIAKALEEVHGFKLMGSREPATSPITLAVSSDATLRAHFAIHPECAS